MIESLSLKSAKEVNEEAFWYARLHGRYALAPRPLFAGENKTPRAIWVVSELIKSEPEAVLNTKRF